MFPPHRPALASTSNLAQISTSGATNNSGNVIGMPMRTPEPSPRMRKDATTVCIKFKFYPIIINTIILTI